jgi:transposase
MDIIRIFRTESEYTNMGSESERDNRDREIVLGYKSGESTKTLAERHGLSTASINRIIKSQGIRRGKDRIIDAHARGMSSIQISEEYGLSTSYVTRILRTEAVYKKSERDKRDREIFFARISGDSVKAIAEEHGLSKSAIGTILRSQGFGQKKDLGERNEHIIALHKKGKTAKAIADELGIKDSTVRSWLKENGFRWIPKKINCRICGTTFLQKVATHGLCSDGCRTVVQQQKNARRIEEDIGTWKKCEYCEKPFKVYGSKRYRQRFCSVSCARYYRHTKNELRDKEIFYLRDVQSLTYTRIAEIFALSHARIRAIYKEQRLQRNMERGQRS